MTLFCYSYPYTQQEGLNPSSGSVYRILPVLGNGKLAIDSGLYFYNVIALLGFF